MWHIVKNVQIFLQSIRPIPIQYSKESKSFIENKSKARKRWSLVMDTNVALVWFVSCYALTSSVSEDSSGNPDTLQAEVLNMVLQFLLLAMDTLILASAWTFRYRGPVTIFMIENSQFLSEKRKAGETSESKRSDEILFAAILYGVVVVCFSGSFIHAATPILSDSTPAHIIFKWIIPEAILAGIGPWLTVLCCAYMGFIGYIGVLPIIQALMFQCGFLFESQFTLKPAYGKGNLSFAALKMFTKKKIVYHQSFLFIQGYNTFGYVWFSALMGSAFFLNVISTLICIRFHSILHPLLLGFFVGFDIICGLLTAMIHTISMLSSEEAAQFLAFWGPNLFSKQQRKDYKACLPIRVEIGPFFTLSRATLLNTTSEIVNSTVSLLML